MKRILILAGSPRKNGNSAVLCKEFARGAEGNGHWVETIYLRDKKIGYGLACYHCKDNGICILKDDMADILKKMNESDVIVMASPVYFYSASAQIKALIDRVVAQWRIIKNKEFYYIMTANEDTDTVMDCTLECMRGLAKCLDGSIERGVIYGKGVYGPGEIESRQALHDAYDMGCKV